MFSKLKSLLKKSISLDQPSKKPESDTEQVRSEGKEIKEKTSQRSEINAQTVKKGIKGITKQGLPVFHDNQDVGLLFDDDDAPPSERKKTDTSSTTALKPSPPPKPRFNKHGFPILDHHRDIETIMLQAVPDAEQTAHEIGPKEEIKKKDKAPLTKHGIRILQDGDMLFDAGDEEDERFEDLLYESLGQKNLDVLLHEKKDSEKKRKKLTLKQQLKSYPSPQGQLDLHGYTAMKAELRVETYLKSAYHNQTHTVNIIVGKGLHSDEGAVLPDVVENKLNQMKKDGVVLAYEWDSKRKSRSGAVIVYLDTRNY